jgi:uncharacterized protein YecT (DUF1311 family)
MRSILLIASGLALLGAPATAQPVDCAKAVTTYEMNSCADQDYLAADAALNDIYRQSLAQIARSGGQKPYDAKSWEAALRASQRAWVAFRDAECKGLVPMEWTGGSGATVAVLGCMTRLTEARAADLRERFLNKGPARVP